MFLGGWVCLMSEVPLSLVAGGGAECSVPSRPHQEKSGTPDLHPNSFTDQKGQQEEEEQDDQDEQEQDSQMQREARERQQVPSP